jgi:parvulin-like peptidyl-prolyl isomerase
MWVSGAIAAAVAVLAVLSLRCPARAQHAAASGDEVAEPEREPEAEATDAAVAPVDAAPPISVQSLVADAAVPVAEGRGVVVTAGELVQRVADAPEVVQRAWAANPALMNELLDRLVADRLLANEARRLGLERDPYVRAAVERALVARLRATVINPSAGDGSRVTMDDIRAFYDAHPSRFHIPERRRAVVIFFTDRREAERVLRQVRPTGRRRRPADFRELARRLNTDPDLVRTDGELHDVTASQTDIDPALRDAIFAIPEPGQVAPEVIRGHWRGTPGYFLVRLTSRRRPIDRTLAESADWIRQRLVLERRVAAERALVERLAAEARVARTPAERVVRLVVADAGAPDASGAH